MRILKQMRSITHSGSGLRAWIILGLTGAFLAGCGGGGESRDPILGVENNVANAPVPPTVTAVAPANNATGVALDLGVVTAQFSEAVNAITSTNFTLTCAAPCASPSGVVSMNTEGTTASFTLPGSAILAPSTRYTATIASAVSSSSGLALLAPYVWQFTTSPRPPTVTAVAPINNATGVALNNTVITAQFSQPVNAITASNFTVTCATPCVNASGTVSMNAAGTVATFNVASPALLEPSTLYTATIISAVASASGLSMEAPYAWQFTTGITPDTTRPRVTLTEPLTTSPGPTMSVPANTAISAVFSEDLNPTTVSGSSFTLTCSFPCVSPSGAVSYIVGSRTAVFTPDNVLEAGTTYTATVVSNVTDLAGNQLAGNQGPITSASDYIWTFTTEVALVPNNISVQSTFPLDGGMVESCPLVGINATFDVPSGLRLDPNTATTLTFQVVEDANPLNVVIAESVTLDVNTGQIMTFTPLASFTEGVTYRVTVKGGPAGVKDLAVPGNEMLLDAVWTFTVVAPANPCVAAVPLGAATPFGGFGGSAGMTNDGLLTVINGDISTTAASTTVTGFISAAGCRYTVTPINQGQVNGRIYTAPPAPTTPPTGECLGDGTAVTEQIAIQARSDANDAFISISPAALPGGATVNQNLGSQTLAPGVYFTPTSYLIEGGDLTLDAMGNQNAVWVFQMGSTLSVGEAAVPRSVVLINGAQAKNVFWQVSSFATINPSGGGTMVGTIIAESGVSLSTTGNFAPNLVVTLNGRALSLTASVTMTNTIINVPAP